MNIQIGDHLRVWRGGYFHHGICVGPREVIHYTMDGGGKLTAVIGRDSLERFARGRKIEVVRYSGSSPEQTLARATSRLGENGYDLFGNNCEHFARWCVTGESRSRQIEDAAATAGGATTAALLAIGGAGLASVVGVSGAAGGAALMSGLKTLGAGLGPAGGLGVLAAAPALTGIVAATIMFADDANLDDAERAARKAARLAAITAGAIGTVGTVGVVAGAGIPGLSSAGITSGLAAIGGGMKVGAILVALLPAGLALGAAILAYRVARRRNA